MCPICYTPFENKTLSVHCEYCICMSLSVDYCCQTAKHRKPAVMYVSKRTK